MRRRVSADSLTDEATGRGCCRALVEPRAAALQAAGVALYPGMPVEVMIRTGERTLFEYLAEPVLPSTGRAFRED